MKIKKFMVVFAAALFLPVAIATADVSDNLYWGQVTDVYDGDSLTAEIALWPGHYVQAKVRIRGIDAPEIRGKCEAERQQARLARDTQSNNHEWEMASLADKDKGLRYLSYSIFALPILITVVSPANGQQIFANLERVAPSELSVLVQGETGTGKELIARAIHNFSRKDWVSW